LKRRRDEGFLALRPFYSNLLANQSSLPLLLLSQMARMVATKAALSIRLDALADADSKSAEGAPTIGIEARAKLESRLRGLEHQSGASGLRTARGDGGYKQKPFEMTGDGKTYNNSADAPVADVSMTEVKSTTEAETSVKLSKEEKKALKRKAKDEDEDEDEKKLSKEERKAIKKARKSEGDVTKEAKDDKLSKEERKAAKKARKSEGGDVSGEYR